MVKPAGKIVLTAGQFARYLALNETPVIQVAVENNYI